MNYRNPSRGAIAQLVFVVTVLNVYGEGEWKICKLHMAIDAARHELIAAKVSLESVTDRVVLPTLLNPLRRKI